mmetsp:Transcript_21298/g.59426  ORF Transcript_21298/g.59426 Transcript_21298/m.59426 type:complete len:258 (+) Transcript_21298:186-959(+)
MLATNTFPARGPLPKSMIRDQGFKLCQHAVNATLMAGPKLTSKQSARSSKSSEVPSKRRPTKSITGLGPLEHECCGAKPEPVATRIRFSRPSELLAPVGQNMLALLPLNTSADSRTKPVLAAMRARLMLVALAMRQEPSTDPGHPRPVGGNANPPAVSSGDRLRLGARRQAASSRAINSKCFCDSVISVTLLECLCIPVIAATLSFLWGTNLDTSKPAEELRSCKEPNVFWADVRASTDSTGFAVSQSINTSHTWRS